MKKLSFRVFPSGSNAIILGALAVAVVAIIAYMPAINNGFIWDDYDCFLNSPLIKSQNAFYKLWLTTESADYYPLVYSLFRIEYQLWGTNPRPYHLANIFIHALGSALLWLVLSKLRVPGAFVSALVFAVHPVNVEAVAWIFQQRTTLPLVFMLVAILAYLQFYTNFKTRWYVIALVAFLLGLLSKSSIVMLPCVLLGCVWWQRGKIARCDLIWSVPFFIQSLAFGILTIWFQSHRAIGGEIIRNDNFLARMAGAGWAVWFYLYKALIPYKLTFVYPKWNIDSKSIISYIPLAILVFCLIVFAKYRKSWGRPLLAAFGYYFLMLLPVLGFFDIYFMKFSLVADHWQYVAIPGVIVLVIGIAAFIFKRFGRKGMLIGAIGAIAIVGLLTEISWKQEKIYKYEETIWRDTIAKNPTAWLAHYNLGLSLVGKGKHDEAFEHFRETLRFNPRYAEAHNNIGLILQMRGELDQAVLHFRKALEIKPIMAEVHNNLGNALADLGRYEEAMREYKEAIRIDRNFASAYNNLGVVLASQGNYDEAIVRYKQAIELKPDYREAHQNLAVAFFAKGMYEDAWREVRWCREYGMAVNPAFIRELSKKMPEYLVR
ncbi:MAG: tetratricopeptide repeat protein [Armatimonadota bacterium]|nr:tetratricopeptide repeat protein [Armatimonadota bacterium]